MATRTESVVFLDTHVVAWLFDAMVSRLSQAAEQAIEQAPSLAVSPMVRLELKYLQEIGRIRASPGEMLAELRQSIGLRETDPSLGTVIDVALAIDWTRDTFDRLIVAEAKSLNAGLVTKDGRIREHYALAIW